MRQSIQKFLAEEHAQDMVEYTLLIALVALAAAAIFTTSTQSIGGIGRHDTETLNTANSLAAS
jgi:Flp pilus assembly pilin Flp